MFGIPDEMKDPARRLVTNHLLWLYDFAIEIIRSRDYLYVVASAPGSYGALHRETTSTLPAVLNAFFLALAVV